jgi:hypothetical protein
MSTRRYILSSTGVPSHVETTWSTAPQKRTSRPRIVEIHCLLPARLSALTSAFSMSTAADGITTHGVIRAVELFVE